MNENKIAGFVRSAELALPVLDVTIDVYDQNNEKLVQYTANDSGAWEIDVLDHGQYVVFSASGYVSKVFHKNPGKLVRLLKDEIIGYQDRLWFYPGEEVSVYTHSPEKYKAILCRHGGRKECVLEIKGLEKQQQQVPDSFFVAEGLNWQKSFDYKIPESARPGLYSLLLETDAQTQFAIPMVVSSAKSPVKNQLLVMASTNTWQSYNIWGGRSRYRNFEYLYQEINQDTRINIFRRIRNLIKFFIPAKIVDRINEKYSKPSVTGPDWMHQRLSINRPLTNCFLEAENWNCEFTNHLARAEWCILAWLENQHIDYDLISGADLHFNPDSISDYKAIILSTHCEYWSREMYESLKHYHDKHGLWILNLSGNSMYREINFFEDGSTRCSSLDFSQTCEDESKLLGVRFTSEDYGTCAPYKIVDPEHWVFAGTAARNGDEVFGERSLNQQTDNGGSLTLLNTGRPQQGEQLLGFGASGWETDKLTQTAPGDFKLVAKGMNPNGGAEMVVRDPDKTRGGVFSGSSIVFGGSLPVDAVCSAIVKNVLNRALTKTGCKE